MSGQTIRNHRDRPRHIPIVNALAGPSSGVQPGSHVCLYSVMFDTSSGDIPDKNSSDGSNSVSDESEGDDGTELGPERPTKRRKLLVCH